jgi:hypothetical protein
MGVWGTSIFSVHTASDERGDYRDLVGNGISGARSGQAECEVTPRRFSESSYGILVVRLAAKAEDRRSRWGEGLTSTLRPITVSDRLRS